jgi:queuine tRNA-ribosyltransferase
MGRARDAIIGGTFPDYLKHFFKEYFGLKYPKWCVDALLSVGVDILEGRPEVQVVDGNFANWEYSDGKQ